MNQVKLLQIKRTNLSNADLSSSLHPVNRGIVQGACCRLLHRGSSPCSGSTVASKEKQQPATSCVNGVSTVDLANSENFCFY
jgi:hypothetical protein